MLDIVIIGAGGFGREVYQWALDTFDMKQYRIKGFIAYQPDELDGFDIPVPILGNDQDYRIEEADRFLLAIGETPVRKRLAENYRKRGAQFLTLLHPKAIVFRSARIGEGSIVCPFVVVSDAAMLGDFVLANLYVYCAHDVRIGDYCTLAPYAVTTGWVTLGDEVFMGTHASVAPHRVVGTGAKISANSLVLKDVAPHALIRGVPGQPVA